MQISKLVPYPESVSVNNGFLLYEGDETHYVYKNVPSMVIVQRIHPGTGEQMECILKTHTIYRGPNDFVCTLRKVDTLHIYGPDELRFVLRMHKQHFDNGILAVATPEQMKQLEGTRYVLGRSLLETEAF